MFPLLVVIHETLIDAQTSKTLHGDPEYYASYHALVERNGNVVYLTPAEHKAYAAANSAFTDVWGDVEEVNGSVDDFAYHIALETPEDGVRYPHLNYHTGYTLEQYKSLAWLCASTVVHRNRITTHGNIVIPKTTEPKCFNFDYFDSMYNEIKRSTPISINVGI
jgi:N-acetyl-anhydromuramyl-L-alanine amidase AmpD